MGVVEHGSLATIGGNSLAKGFQLGTGLLTFVLGILIADLHLHILRFQFREFALLLLDLLLGGNGLLKVLSGANGGVPIVHKTAIALVLIAFKHFAGGVKLLFGLRFFLRQLVFGFQPIPFLAGVVALGALLLPAFFKCSHLLLLFRYFVVGEACVACGFLGGFPRFFFCALDFIHLATHSRELCGLGDFLQNVGSFRLATRQEFCELVLGKHRGAAELVEIQPYHFCYLCLQFSIFDTCRLYAFACGKVGDAAINAVDFVIDFLFLATLHLPFCLVVFAVVALEKQFNQCFAGIATHQSARVPQREFIVAILHGHLGAFCQAWGVVEQCQTNGIENGGFACASVAGDEIHVAVAKWLRSEVDGGFND